MLGEINGPIHTNIRTSIIGPELFNNSRGPLSWVLKNQESNYIEGYSKSIWSGITTIELSKAIIYCIEILFLDYYIYLTNRYQNMN